MKRLYRKMQDILGNSFFEETYNKADYLKAIFSEKPQDESQEGLENRYKIIVLTLLPIICSRVRAIFFSLTFVLSTLITLLLKLLIQH